MFHFLIFIFIFLFILTLYLHIIFNLKTSNNLEIYEINYTNKQQLENICNLKQPLIFNYIDIPEFKTDNLLKYYSKKEINIKNNNTNQIIPIQLSKAFQLFKTDNTSSYYSFNNYSFLANNDLLPIIHKNDNNIKPIFTGKSIYDILFGSNLSTTPLQYDINYRNYLLVTEGSIKIRFSPPVSIKHLEPMIDYENLFFNSSINVWDISAENKEKIEDIKFIDIIVNKGQIIHIPPYWWYSIQFQELSTIVSFKYRTYTNILTIFPHLFIQFLQNQNIKYVFNNFKSKIIEPKKIIKKIKKRNKKEQIK